MNDLSDLAAIFSSSRVNRTQLPDGTGVVLDIVSRQVMSLNETGQFVVEQLAAGVSDEQQLVQRMVTHFHVDAGQAGRDLATFVARLSALLRPESASASTSPRP